MKRILEPELMDDVAQARAYAQADFAEENQGFVDRFREYFPDWTGGHVVDLGCGPADIPIRFLRAFPDARVTGVDASRPMLDLAAALSMKPGWR
jgi:trans-aconitate methyltransferase